MTVIEHKSCRVIPMAERLRARDIVRGDWKDCHP